MWRSIMILNYPLKQGEVSNIVEPIMHYLQRVESFDKIPSFQQGLQGMQALRGRVVNIQLEERTEESIEEALTLLQKYVKLAELTHRHLNWNQDNGEVITDLKVTWKDSFQPKLVFSKNEMEFDLYCVYYNIGVLRLERALLNAMKTSLHGPLKQAIKDAKAAYYVLDKIRNKMEAGFVNIKFFDTSREHLEMLEVMAKGVVYKCMLVLLEEDEFKVGLDQMAMVAKLAEENFYRAYTIASMLFLRECPIPNAIKEEVLSFVYVEALYHQVQFNQRCATYYRLIGMEKDTSHIARLIAHQRKAVKLISIAFNTQQVDRFLKRRELQHKHFQNLLPSLQEQLRKNVLNNQHVYKKGEASEEEIAVFKPVPAKLVLQPIEPESLYLSYDGTFTKLFVGMQDNQSRAFKQDLVRFTTNKLTTLTDIYANVKKSIEAQYNDNFVNYYLNLNSKAAGVPEKLKQKIRQIQLCGGRKRLESDMEVIKNSAAGVMKEFQKLREALDEETKANYQKRSQYGEKWKIVPSEAINQTYYNDISVYEKNNQQAIKANAKIMAQFDQLKQYIELIDAPDHQLLQILPKMEISVFIRDNAAEFEDIRQGATKIQESFREVETITNNIKKAIEKMNLNDLASKYYKEVTETNRESIYETIFGSLYDEIKKFNQRCVEMQNESKKVAGKAYELNRKNKGGDEQSRLEFENVMSKFDAISLLFKDLSRGTSFYTKISSVLLDMNQNIYSFVEARRIEASDYEEMLKRAPKFPALYNNAPTPGLYLPPPIRLDSKSPISFNQSTLDQQIFDFLNSKVPMSHPNELFSKK